MTTEHMAGGQPLNPNSKKKENEELQEKMAEARQQLERTGDCPAGYVEVRLSTDGLIGAPASFHIRNLSTEDLMNLGLSEQEDLPIRVVKMLDRLILEEDVSVQHFHEKEVIELILFIYEAFYTDVFPNLDWPLTDEDWDELANQLGGRDTEEFRRQEFAYKNGDVKLKFDVDLRKGVHYHKIDPNIKTKVRVTKSDGFSAVFSVPKFGDVMTLRYFVEAIWKEKDKQFASIRETIKFRRDAEDRLKKGENINIRSVPNVPKAELDKFKEYELEKSIFTMTAVKAYHLEEFNGQDVSRVPLEQKIQLAQDPHLDHSTFEEVQKHFGKLEFGIKEEITVRDPILNKIVDRKYSFQLTDLLQAIRDQRPSDTVLSFE
jgi:hypothetical protein